MCVNGAQGLTDRQTDRRGTVVIKSLGFHLFSIKMDFVVVIFPTGAGAAERKKTRRPVETEPVLKVEVFPNGTLPPHQA